MVAAGSEKLFVMKTRVLPDGVLEADAPQKFGVILTGVEAVRLVQMMPVERSVGAE